MKFIIEPTNWVKRRKPKVEPLPIDVSIPDLELIRDAKCSVFVTYSDQVTRELTGRVILNEIKQTWSVSAIANGGWMVSVAVIMDET